MYHWPNIPPPFTPRAMRFRACGPGGVDSRISGVARGRRPAPEIRHKSDYQRFQQPVVLAYVGQFCVGDLPGLDLAEYLVALRQELVVEALAVQGDLRLLFLLAVVLNQALGGSALAPQGHHERVVPK